jgi:DNA invertase Pin-like site-specific DNA recombinase
MSEAELHVLRARLNGGIRNKATRGELRRGLPIGLVWGEADGEVRFHPDAAVTGALGAVFDRFREVTVQVLLAKQPARRVTLRHA